MKAVFTGILASLVSLPIWFYLMYQILVRVDASELMFFLFWIYVPVTMLLQVLVSVGKK